MSENNYFEIFEDNEIGWIVLNVNNKEIPKNENTDILGQKGILLDLKIHTDISQGGENIIKFKDLSEFIIERF